MTKPRKDTPADVEALRCAEMHAAHARPIPGFSGYMVCPCGLVVSLPKGVQSSNRGRTRILTPGWYRRDKGYQHVTLYIGRVRYQRPVHQLVLLAFVGPAPEGKPEGCHWDRNPANNRVENLRWGSRQDNGKDMVRHGSVRGEKHPSAHVTEAMVVAIRQAHAGGAGCSEIAKAFGITRGHACSIYKRHSWKHVL